LASYFTLSCSDFGIMPTIFLSLVLLRFGVLLFFEVTGHGGWLRPALFDRDA